MENWSVDSKNWNFNLEIQQNKKTNISSNKQNKTSKYKRLKPFMWPIEKYKKLLYFKKQSSCKNKIKALFINNKEIW